MNVDKIFKLADTNNTRGHNLNILKPRMVKGPRCRREFFSQREMKSCNKLPDQVVNAVSINSFKSELENYWKRYWVLKASTLIRVGATAFKTNGQCKTEMPGLRISRSVLMWSAIVRSVGGSKARQRKLWLYVLCHFIKYFCS